MDYEADYGVDYGVAWAGVYVVDYGVDYTWWTATPSAALVSCCFGEAFALLLDRAEGRFLLSAPLH